MVLTTEPFPADDDAAPAHELFDLALSREMLTECEMLGGRRLADRHRALLAGRRAETSLDPTLPVIRVRFDEKNALRLQQANVKAFADMLDDRAGLRRPVVPLAMLLRCASADRGPIVMTGLLPDERIDDFGHVAGVDPDLVRRLDRWATFERPTVFALIAKLLQCDHQCLLDAEVVAGDFNPPIIN